MTKRTRSRRRRSNVLLFLDYDGTLVGFQDAPQLAVLSPGRRRLLRQLAAANPVVIATGRSLAVIKRLIGLRNVAYIGNHGLEMEWQRRIWVHPRALAVRPALEEAIDRIIRRSEDVPNRRLENKGLTASVHYRQLSPRNRARMERIVKAELRPQRKSVRLLLGNKVWEIRPCVDWDKGKAVLQMRRWMGAGADIVPVYLGDDHTDEDAFRALRRDGVTFRVGKCAGRTAALGRIPDVSSVWKFLGLFLRT